MPATMLKEQFLAAIDPMALILPPDVYPIWAEAHHPHEPKVAEVAKLVKALTPEQVRLAGARVKALRGYLAIVEEAGITGR